MTKDELRVALEFIRAAYPHEYRGMDAGELKAVVNVWHSYFEDVPAVIVFAAVRQYVGESAAYAPKVADILDKVERVKRRIYMDTVRAIASIPELESSKQVATISDNTIVLQFAKIPVTTELITFVKSDYTENQFKRDVARQQMKQAHDLEIEKRKHGTPISDEHMKELLELISNLPFCGEW